MNTTAVLSRDEAQQVAQEWQAWASGQSLSYEELMEWQNYFEGLANHWDLVDEFEENGII